MTTSFLNSLVTGHAVRCCQEPSREGIDTEGIDARGGDTAGIYGFAREVVEKEEAQAPFRRLRLIGYAVPAFVSCKRLFFVGFAEKAGRDIIVKSMPR